MSINKIYDINRELIKIGFEEPVLFSVLREEAVDDIEAERKTKYIQLWINHLSVIWESYDNGFIREEQWISIKRDIIYTMALDSMQEHWRNVKAVYPDGFTQLIEQSIKAANADKRLMEQVVSH